MFSLNQSQTSFTATSGIWLRGYRNAAKSIKKEDPATLRALLQMPETSARQIFAKCKEDVLFRIIPALSQFSPFSKSASPSNIAEQNQTSYTSADTFFENNHGFKEADLLVTPLTHSQRASPVTHQLSRNDTVFGQFLSRNSSSPFLVSSRGFKTRRPTPTDYTPFQKDRRFQDHQKSDPLLSDIFGDTNDLGLKKRAEIDNLKAILDSAKLTPEERAKVFAALNGYAAGFDSAKGGQLGKLSSASNSSSSSTSSGSGIVDPKDDKSKFSGKMWDKVNKLATLLIIVMVIVSLTKLGVVNGGFGIRVSHEIAPEEIEVTFDDVKGCDEAKTELEDIVEFLMNPEKFTALGGKLPKGVLLVGPPGTGKTLMAKAVAGQANVPFFHAAGSEFDEVFVGQGARRIRDLFKAAKQKAPCVIFIDEIDSVGSKRINSAMHPYANQTINQLLSEMDGFLENEGVIIMGATNRKEALDKALLRPGRFDTHVDVPLPDRKGREEILSLYMNKIKTDNQINTDSIVGRTFGFSGADIQNLVNTAAIRAALDGKEHVTMAEFDFAYDKHVMGTDWKSRVRDKEDLKITAYHEAGHTLVTQYTKGSKPLHKVTIAAKGGSGGHTAFVPEKDSTVETKSKLFAMMDVSMGGRAAEELVFGKDNVTSGAQADLNGSTNLATAMVRQYGMSDKVGLRFFDNGSGGGSEIGPATYEQIDEEINSMLSDSYKRAMAILRSHRRELDLLAEALLNYETLDAEDVKAIIEGNTTNLTLKKKQEFKERKMAALNRKSSNGQKPAAGLPASGGTTADVLVNRSQ